MLPRLTAEESLLATTRGQLGAGVAPKQFAEDTYAEWARVINGQATSDVKPSPTVNTSVAAKFKIGVRKVKKARG